MTVADLIAKLQDADPNSVVYLAYNSGCSYDDARSVEIDRDHDGPIVFISTQEEQQ